MLEATERLISRQNHVSNLGYVECSTTCRLSRKRQVCSDTAPPLNPEKELSYGLLSKDNHSNGGFTSPDLPMAEDLSSYIAWIRSDSQTKHS